MKRVVVTGMGVVSPVGNDVQSFWAALTTGTCGVDFIRSFDTENFKVKIAAEVKDFDPLQYMEKGEARKADRYTQFAVAAASQAVADSGIEGKVAPERFGVYIGSGIGGMQTFINECRKLDEKGPKRVSPFFVPMMIGNMATGTAAIKFHAKGPSLPIVTACATSSNSIGEAYRAIRFGYADAIIAGGAEAAINPLSIAGFTNCMALTDRNDPASASIPFDKRRDGFVIGEGGGALILEEYEHAKARGAKIYAEITGYGNTNDAHHMTAPDPEAEGPANAIRIAMEEAGVTADARIYLNAHGTSTPLNDKTETLAVKKALGGKTDNIVVSSTKSMTGHMLGAAGAAEAIAAVLALQNSLVPPTIGYQEPDPECDLDVVPNQAREVKLDAAMSTSLGFGGHNACLLFQPVER